MKTLKREYAIESRKIAERLFDPDVLPNSWWYHTMISNELFDLVCNMDDTHALKLDYMENEEVSLFFCFLADFCETDGK